MNFILSVPMDVRLLVVFALGVCLASLANLGIYCLAWNPRPISPWSRPDPAAPPRRWSDRLPILGWLGLRREAKLHGGGPSAPAVNHAVAPATHRDDAKGLEQAAFGDGVGQTRDIAGIFAHTVGVGLKLLRVKVEKLHDSVLQN